MQPVTPPRNSGASQKPRSILFTPPTPMFKTSSPQKVSKPQQQLSPVRYARQSQLQTPNPTPRHRKKNSLATSGQLLDDAFTFHNTTRTLFPPTPSTVGSGRTKTDVFKSPMKSRVEESPSISGASVMRSPEVNNISVAKRRLTFNVESDEDEEVKDAPTTPEGKVISRSLAEKWAEDIPERMEEDTDVFIEKKTIVNPFVTNDGGSKEFILKKPSKPLEFVEYVNKKGEKIVKKAGTLETTRKSPTPLVVGQKKKFEPKNLFGELKKADNSFEVFTDDS
ncbi:Protein SIC1 [Cyberlindnera fabianii]|uniref:Protein SIC1 n=1 Tax=Cyberlindnera fabianii TaxID=36022 RepID=A0A1V2L981_CYBFA|nr:Protein SIC1 [Cyberlindnera fabianii]